MKLATATILIIAIVSLVIVSGCTSSQPVDQVASQPNTSTTQCSLNTCPVASTPAAEPASPPTGASSDPIIGDWQLKNAPYSCSAVFYGSGTGHLSCSLYLMSQTKNFSWKNNGTLDPYNTSYIITLSDGSGTIAPAVMGQDGRITSGVLPTGSYLIREE